MGQFLFKQVQEECIIINVIARKLIVYISITTNGQIIQLFYFKRQM